jgi:hypothetical protein
MEQSPIIFISFTKFYERVKNRAIIEGCADDGTGGNRSEVSKKTLKRNLQSS